jgi:multiple sugar transport system substrate-binding protein
MGFGGVAVRFAAVLGIALCAAANAPLAGTLVVNANASDPAPRAAWQAVVDRFAKENPDVRVELNVYDHESYKKAIRNWLTGSPPDVVFWFAGERMRQLSQPGLLEDVSDLYTREARADFHPSAVALVTDRGRQYGVPYTSYQIGLYYRRDILQGAGIDAPRTWDDLLAACEKLAARGLEPIAIGTRDLWPAAAWFDYLDLRINGLAFHMALMDGRVAYTDARVRAVLAAWRELLARDCFSANHASSTWQESQALLYQGRSAMMLIGNYIVPNFPAAVRDRMAFVRFPTLDPAVPAFEEAPMNTLHIPARASNKADARRFLSFVMRADVQEEINRAMLTIPVNTRAAVADDRFLVEGRDLLRNAAGLSQFFDRDTREDLASVAMKGFQEFMLNPQRADAVLAAIERARLRIYGPASAARNAP